MSYYDIDAILTDAQKVPCTFELDVPQLGYLDNNPSQPLKAGTLVDLPLWLGVILAATSPPRPLVTLDLPACFAARVLHALRADAARVDLRAQAPAFYGLGERLLELFDEEDEADRQLLDVLTETFRRRAAELGDHAANAGQGAGPKGGGGGVGGADGVEFLRGLDETERALFRATHESSKAVRMWIGETKKG